MLKNYLKKKASINHITEEKQKEKLLKVHVYIRLKWSFGPSLGRLFSLWSYL